jgi:hypothetical protein
VVELLSKSLAEEENADQLLNQVARTLMFGRQNAGSVRAGRDGTVALGAEARAERSCLVTERAGDPALDDASRPGDEQISAIDELGKEGAPDAARSVRINIFDGCVLP